MEPGRACGTRDLRCGGDKRYITGPADRNHRNCNRMLFSESSKAQSTVVQVLSNLWLQLQWLQCAGPMHTASSFAGHCLDVIRSRVAKQPKTTRRVVRCLLVPHCLVTALS